MWSVALVFVLSCSDYLCILASRYTQYILVERLYILSRSSFYHQCEGITMVGGSVVIGGSSPAAVLREF